MKKIMIFWALLALFTVPSFVSADADMEKISRANSVCFGIDSSDRNVRREAVKKCDNANVHEAVLYYHTDFGARFFAAKKISDNGILKKAYEIAKKAELEGSQSKIRDRLLQLIESRLDKDKSKDVTFSAQEIRKMKDLGELAKIFYKHPDFEARYHAIKRVYAIFTYLPDSDSYFMNDVDSRMDSLEKMKETVSKAIPKMKAMDAQGKRQKFYKKKLLTELKKMRKMINPKPGEQVYIDTEEFMRLLNAFRKENGLEPIKRYDSRLNTAALKWAKYHYKNQLPHLTHEHNGNTHGKRINAEEYDYRYSGENLDKPALPNAKSIFIDWQNSPGHRKNMLGENYREMGLACVYAPLGNREKTDYVCIQLLTDADHNE